MVSVLQGTQKINKEQYKNMLRNGGTLCRDGKGTGGRRDEGKWNVGRRTKNDQNSMCVYIYISPPC